MVSPPRSRGALVNGVQIVGADAGHRIQRAVVGPRIGMAGEQRFGQGAAGNPVRAGGGGAQIGQHLAADALDIGRRIEARLAQGEPQQLEGRARACPTGCAASRREVSTSALKESCAAMASSSVGTASNRRGRRLRRAAPPSCGWRLPCRSGSSALPPRKSEAHGDDRRGLVLHQPGANARGRDHFLDVDGARRATRQSGVNTTQANEQKKPRQADHFFSPAGPAGRSAEVTDCRRGRHAVPPR